MKKKNNFLNYINLKRIILILILFCFSSIIFSKEINFGKEKYLIVSATFKGQTEEYMCRSGKMFDQKKLSNWEKGLNLDGNYLCTSVDENKTRLSIYQ